MTAYFVDHPLTDASQKGVASKLALIHGYHVSFFWGAVLLFSALVVATLFINAKKDDIPTAEEAMAA